MVGADGWPIGEMGHDGRLDAETELSAQRRRISERNDLFEDRRPDLYGPRS
ncbi:hypothetical protein [Leucobacter triazinivorans]|uniref:hypothetical protein n=1 Tax=Leucobacter triazinivorans TaxID=1784719 RepID=UPI00197E1588|nr:hypothetical protein [Leucobacter triazinivorans]